MWRLFSKRQKPKLPGLLRPGPEMAVSLQPRSEGQSSPQGRPRVDRRGNRPPPPVGERGVPRRDAGGCGWPAQPPVRRGSSGFISVLSIHNLQSVYDSAHATSCNLSNRPLRRKLRLRDIRKFDPRHSRAPAPWTRSCGHHLSPSCSSGAQLQHPRVRRFLFLFFSFSIGVKSLYNVVLVSAVHQCESALCKVHPVPLEPPTPHPL